MRAIKTRYFDIMAIGLSAVCVVHCLALPVIFAILPFLGAFNENPVVHRVLVSLAGPLCVFALVRSGGWQHWRLVGLAIAGLGLLGAAAFFPVFVVYEVPMSVAGASLLAVLHLINARTPHHKEACAP
ncbi:MerC domain-containing protein [Asticcacaulis sp. 201]|uniref:MerC domain-containing protein n=1 Tax=Asticcacaulis sp. 201 TaxID=3028787 RepID=UPI0029166AEA|nr:MerC domain-containing protein [Asticcacaulis sp. 201]MDV6331835.1 MerC domain-containing protein [Asticcacaulis sp. 201]